jgi:hypothetical protein
MASNDAEPLNVVATPPDTGPVAFLTKIVRLPAANDHTPLRIVCVLVLAVVLSITPQPWSAVGFATLVVLALSLARIHT